jgi:hypothetical protein
MVFVAETPTFRSIPSTKRGAYQSMRSLRAFLPVLVLGAASLAFVGVSAALEDDGPPVTDEPTTLPVDDCTTETTLGEQDEVADGTEAEGDDVEGDDETEVPDEPASGDEPANHGAAVSEVAHTCPPGPEHGPCVREVARSDAGKPGHGDDEDTDDDEVSDETTAPGSSASRGGGNGKGNNGKGHGRG